VTLESNGIRVRPLTSVLDGAHPVELVNRLFDAGYDRFYVQVPQGFQPSLIGPFHPKLQHGRSREPESASAQSGSGREIRYLQLAITQMRDLIDYRPVALDGLISGGLEAASASDGLLPFDLKYRKGLLGSLMPIDAGIADRVSTKFDGIQDGPVVVKVSDPSSRQYSYVLNGIRLKDVFIEESALSDALASMRAPKGEAEPVGEDLPVDPYGLRESSPLVFEILRKAYQLRGKARGEIDTPSLRAELRKLNATYKKNPKPFSDKGVEFASTLANPIYIYSANHVKKAVLSEEVKNVLAEPFFDQDFINNRLRKVLYAACCWSGAKEPRLEGDREKLVDLLCGLGFFDRDEDDQVQFSIFFITGSKYKRNKIKSQFRDMRADRG